MNPRVKQQFEYLVTLFKLDGYVLLLSLSYCAIFWTAFYIDLEIENGVIEGKHFYFIFASCLYLIIFSCYLLVKTPNEFRMNLIDFVVFIFLAYSFIHTLILKPSNLLSNTFIELLICTLIYYASKYLMLTASRAVLNTLFFIFLIFGIIHSAYGLLQLYGIEPSFNINYRATGFFFNPAPFAGYLVSILPMGLSLYIFNANENKSTSFYKYFGLSVVLIILLIIPSTHSRASWLALLGGVSIIFFNNYRLNKQNYTLLNNGRFRLSTSILGILIISFLLIKIYQWKEDSANGRLLSWKISIQQISDKPLFGVGINNFTRAFGEKQAAYFEKTDFTKDEAMVAGKGEYAFNEFLNIAVERGILGLGIFVILIFFPIKTFFKKHSNNYMVIGSLGGLVSLIIFGFFSYPFSMIPLLFNFYFFLSIISSANQDSINIKLKNGLRIAVLISIIGISFILMYHENNRYSSLRKWKTASQLKVVSNYKDASKIMEEISPRLSNRGDFMLEYGQILKLNGEFDKSIKIFNKASSLTSDPYLYNSLGQSYQELKMYKEAEKCFLHSYYLIPHRFYPRYLLVKLYEEMGEFQKAKNVARKVKNMEVKVPSKAVDEILIEMDRILQL